MCRNMDLNEQYLDNYQKNFKELNSLLKENKMSNVSVHLIYNFIQIS